MREGRIFCVGAGERQLFPGFQFEEDGPKPVIAELLERLPDDMTPWQIAFWFRSGNGWPDGRSPEEALDDRNGVLKAADRLGDTAVG